jgi:uncharacterized protein (TIGR02001 family)
MTELGLGGRNRNPAMTFRLIAPLAAVLALSPLAAQAGSLMSGVLVPQILVASDYRYDGVSSNAEHPVIQGSLYWWRPDKTYAGIFVSQVDYRDPGKTSYEVDVYAGRHFDVKGTEITPEVMYTAFPDNRTWGPTYDFLQLKVKAKRKVADELTLGGDVSWVPEASYRSGVAWRVSTDASYQLTPKFALTGQVGRRWIHKGYDRTFWAVGGKYAAKTAEFELRYIGTDLKPAQCGYLRNDWCAPAVVGTLTLNLPYLPLGR